MALAGAWVAFPLLLTLVTTGWGLLVEQAAGARIPGGLLPALGLAALGALLTLTSSLEPDLGLPLVVAGAAGGLGLCAVGSGPRGDLKSLRPHGAGAAVALVAFALFAAPVVFSGAPAVSGYLRLDDTTTFLALGDWVFQHGRSTAGLAPSTYETSLTLYLASGYPVGSMLPLVAVGRLQGHELMWLWMPYISVLGALLALAIEVILRPLAPDARARVPAAVLASASALLFGYALWGGIKEVWTAALAALVAALVPWTIETTRAGRPIAIVRGLVPMLVGTAGIVSALSVAGVVWVAPATAVLAAGAAVRRGRSRLVPAAVLGTLVAAVALLPLVRQVPFVRSLTQAPTSGPEWLGKLLEPLSPLQVLGIWPAEDFRVEPVAAWPAGLLLAAVCLGGAWALAQALGRRDWGLLSYAGVLVAAGAVLGLSDWAWAEAKALAIAAPVPLALAGAGAANLLSSGPRQRLAGGLLLAAIAIGVVWSDALAFRGTTLTPYERHEELVDINKRFAGRGPTLITEYEPYATRWFLRALDPEGAGELRRRTVPLADGGILKQGETADIDRFALSGLADYRTLVVRRSPLASRPPSSFQRAWRGRWYEVWERTFGGREALAHLGLGNTVDPGGFPRCSDVRRLAGTAGPEGVLLAAVPQHPAVAGLEPDGTPRSWSVAASGSVIPDGSGEGTARTVISLSAPGRHEVWLGGAFRGRAVVSIDGRDIGSARHELSYAGQLVPFGATDLTAGPHAVSVRLSGGALHPGTDGIDRFPIGPLALVAADKGQPLIEVPANRADRLCGHKLDWVEAAR